MPVTTLPKFGTTHYISTQGLPVEAQADLKEMLGDESVQGPFHNAGRMMRVTTSTDTERQVLDQFVGQYGLSRVETPTDYEEKEPKNGMSLPLALANMWTKYAGRPPGTGLPGVDPRFFILAQETQTQQMFTIDGAFRRPKLAAYRR